VRLKTSEIGVVTSKGNAPTTPIVHVLIGQHDGIKLSTARRDTSEERYAIAEVLHEKKLTMRFEMHHLWGEEARV